MVNIPLSSKIVFPFGFVACDSILELEPAALPPTDFEPKLSGPGLFFFPPAGAGAGADIVGAVADGAALFVFAVSVVDSEMEVDVELASAIGAFVAAKLLPRIGSGSGS